MRMYDIIKKKRDCGILTHEELSYFVSGAVCGSIPDYQISALLMAIYFNGMTDTETAALTELMAYSGDTVDLSRFGSLTADKHSTGGVGDKTTLIAAPAAAALGCRVAKMSGRGLGHTGGTVDKLEAVPGYKTFLTNEEFLQQVEKTGIAVVGQTANLVPADKKLYALRDVTASVDSIPLITSSIMSKKIASGSQNIVLDVKFGSGAFMKTAEEAAALAENMVKIGKSCGRKTVAVITNMDSPLGTHIGNTLELIEAVSVLKGEKKNDLRKISETLAACMAALALDISFDESLSRVRSALDSGSAFEKMLEWISAQGGQPLYIENTALLPQAAYHRDILSPADGCIFHTDTEKIGMAACILGAGRRAVNDKIDFASGIVLNKKTGDTVLKGESLCTLYTNNAAVLTEAEKIFLSAIEISDEKPEQMPLIYKIIN